jgi:hypothetical protein
MNRKSLIHPLLHLITVQKLMSLPDNQGPNYFYEVVCLPPVVFLPVLNMEEYRCKIKIYVKFEMQLLPKLTMHQNKFIADMFYLFK